MFFVVVSVLVSELVLLICVCLGFIPHQGVFILVVFFQALSYSHDQWKYEGDISETEQVG